MTVQKAGFAFWVWIAAVILGPFVPLVCLALARFVAQSRPWLVGWGAIEVLAFIGLPLWTAFLAAASYGWGRKFRPGDGGSRAGITATLFVVGAVISIVWGIVGCCYVVPIPR